MSALFADTFYFLALLNPDDAAHAQASAVSRTRRDPLVTTAWVLTEIADAMCAASRRGRFVDLLKFLRSQPVVLIVPASDELWNAGVELYTLRGDKDWSLTDCISFEVMRRRGIGEALTGDRHFEQAGFTALLK